MKLSLIDIRENLRLTKNRLLRKLECLKIICYAISTK